MAKIIQTSGKVTDTKEEIEEWRPLYLFEKTHTCSNFGRILSLKTNTILRRTMNANGNCYIYIYTPQMMASGKIRKIGKSYEVGWLIAMTFKRASHLNEMFVKHINEDGSDNHVDNLMWLETKKRPNF